MNNNFPIAVKYKKVFPILMLSSSIFILYVSLVVGFSLNTITGIVLLTLSIFMLTRPIALITSDSIQMKNLLGMTLKVYYYTPDNIVITNNSIIINNKKVLSTWLTDINIKQVRELILKE